MTRFYAVATYATPCGSVGLWTGEILATPDTALQIAAQTVRRKRSVAGKLDIKVVPIRRKATP